MKFVGLHAHTTFSTGDGIGYPKDHFEFVLENGMDSLAITDHGSCNSFGYMQQAAKDYKKKGIPFKPIFGVEAYFHPNLADWAALKEAGKVEVANDLVVENEDESRKKQFDPLRRRHHLVVLAQNEVGLKNLFRLVSQSYREGFYRYPRIDFRMLLEQNEGLIISTACVAGLPSWLALRDHEKGSEAIQEAYNKELLPLLEIFGKDRAFLELQFNKLDEQRLTNKELIKFSMRTGYKLIATADSHYARKEWWQQREMYRIMAMNSKGWKPDDMSLPEKIEDLKCELYPKNGDQMFETYKTMYPEGTEALNQMITDAIERTYDIAHNMIDEISPDPTMKLPAIKGEKTPFEILKNLCAEEMKDRGLDSNSVYVDRLVTELKTIKQKEFSPYFLTLNRAMKILRKHVLVGPGRGSGAGSLVCYLLKITQLDPIVNGLLFERFLAEHREGAPDIDTDTENKELCLEVLKEEFGENNVIPVSNFNTLQLKSLVKDISRVYDIPYMEVNNVTTKMEDEARQDILNKHGGDQKFYVFDLENAKEFSPSFQNFLEEYPEVGEHIEVLFRQIKSIGRHAGGIIICDDSEACMPVIRIRKMDQTPWTEGLTAHHCEPWGLIKYDFLALATLRFIRRAIELILKKQGNENPSVEDVYVFYNKHLHPDVMDRADPNIFEFVYQQGKFPGIFQFTETNCQNFCKRAGPKSVDDISAITSIYRPGPLKGNVDKKYVKTRHSDEEITYDHPILQEVLGDTYGFVVYQEQFMILANKLAGFTLNEADKLRKLLVQPETSMAEEMKQKRVEAGERFIAGCIKAGLTEDRATKLWKDEILGFISYGFNKSHAMSYAYISYQCAFLYTYHEEEWIRAYLENDKDRDKAIADVEAQGYKVGKLDINRSGVDWEIDGKKIYPSLMTIKGIGDAATLELMKERHEVGESFSDFNTLFFKDGFTLKTRKPKKVFRFSKFNKRAIAALMKVEAFDSLDIVGEGKMFDNYRHMHNVIINNYDKFKRGSFKVESMALETGDSEKADWSDMEKIENQKELLGTYDKNLLFSSKVLEAFREHDIRPLPDVDHEPRNVWFILKDYKQKVTKTGKDYVSLKITDVDDKIKTLNYFGDEAIDLKRRCIYVGTLQMKNGWLNTVFGTKVVKIS